MAFRQLRIIGDELLKKKAKPVNEINEKIISLLDDMLETMRHYEGVGLAAPQIGALRRIVLVEYEENLYEMINPVIVESDGLQTKDEACLSIPGKIGTVERPMNIAVEYLDREGNVRRLTADDTLAIVICHELDHLEGVLFRERALPNTFREAERENGDGEASTAYMRKRKKDSPQARASQ